MAPAANAVQIYTFFFIPKTLTQTDENFLQIIYLSFIIQGDGSNSLFQKNNL